MGKLAIGLMSGTSADGIGAALVSIEGSGLSTKVKMLKFLTLDYPKEMKQLILECCSENAPLGKVAYLNFLLGHYFADAALSVARAANVAIEDISFIGSHGQTIYHHPKRREGFGISTGYTLQVGEPSVIAQKTGVMTIADFRAADIAVGGEGAPLIPYADMILFKADYNRIALNIGVIANITVLPAKGEIFAFDTGPGNMLIDEAVRRITKGKNHFDKDGEIANKGKVSKAILDSLMKHPFVLRQPPKATGREDFGKHFIDKNFEKVDNELIATLTAFTANSIAFNIKKFAFKDKPKEVIVSGGGVHNKALMAMLAKELEGIEVMSSSKLGIDPDAKEAVGFAILANETLAGNKANIATGAKKKVILGKIIKV